MKKIFLINMFVFMIGLTMLISGCNTQNPTDETPAVTPSPQQNTSPTSEEQMEEEIRVVFREIRASSKPVSGKLAMLGRLEEKYYINFPRMRQEITEEKNAPRITIETARRIIEENKDEESGNVYRLLLEAHGTVDVERGSGMTILELWLDDEGIERIFIHNFNIYYGDELLYGNIPDPAATTGAPES